MALIAAHVYFRSRSGPTGRLSVEKLLHGPYGRLFMYGAVLGGVMAPLLLTAMVVWGVASDALVVPAVLGQLAGIVLFKYCLLNVGLYSPLYTPRLAKASD